MRHDEDNLQIACVRWFDMQYPHLKLLLHHSPNGGRRNAREAGRFKAMGTRPGFADLVLLTSRGGYGALCIEMKAERGVQSPAQKEWQRQAEMGGNLYVVCRSIEEFQKVVNEYLEGV